MTRLKKISILFITIITSAFVCNINALAAAYQDVSSSKVTKVERQEGAVVGLEDTSGSSSTSGGSGSGSGGAGNSQVITQNGAVAGYTCNQFNVSYKETIPGRPYISNQGNILYNVEGCGLQLTAFCLDPNLDGVYAKDGVQAYNASPIELDTEYGKRLLALYKLYNGGTDPQTVFTYQAAARLLMYSEGSDYMSKRNVVKGRLNSHLDVYKSIGGAGAIGSVGGAAASLASQAISMAQGMNAENTSTVGITVSQVGGAKQNGNGYTITLAVTIQNYKPSYAGTLSISGASIVSQSEEVTDNAKIYTVEVALDSFSEGACGTAQLEASYKYNNPDDLRHAYIISPNATFGLAHQNFAVFAAGGSEMEVKTSFTVSNGDGEDCNPDSCKPHGVLTCDAQDGKVVYVTDGSVDGDDKHTSDSEWDSCIFGHTDSKGNSYEVVNTSQMQAREEDDEEDTQLNLITGITTYGEEIKDSDYCTIACREKYSFILPGYKENVKQGTYFSFHTDGNQTTHAVVGVGAERQCVSKAIENEKFNKRVLNLRQQQVDYMNVALFYQQLYNAMFSDEVMEEYKESRQPSTCDAFKDSPQGYQLDGYDKYIPNNCDGLKKKADPDLSKTQILPNFQSEKTGKFTYYTIVDYGSEAENLKHFDLEKHETTLDLDKSFAENIHNQFNAPTTAQWYESTYSDSAKMTEVVANVSYFADTEVSVEYDHHVCTAERVDTICDANCDTDNPTTHQEHHCNNATEHKDSGIIKYLATTEDDAVWESLEINDHIYEHFKGMLDNILGEYNKAIEKYNALQAQIGVQSDSMQECTNFLETIGDTKLAYHFNPDITFSYEEDNYMAMLKPNKLVLMDDVTYTPNYKLYFCEGDVSPSGIFSGCAGDGGTSTEFKFGVQDGIPGVKQEKSSDTSAAAEKLIIKDGEELGKDTTNYYNAKRVGSRATFGEYDANHGQCNKDDPESDCFYFYRSAKAFYTQAPDGLVTIDKNGKNKTILDTDGYVYPVAITTSEGTYEYTVRFSNIGNYFGTVALGRIMGDGNALLSGKAQDALVCNYEVTRFDGDNCTEDLGNGKTKVHQIPKECNEGESTEDCRERLCPSNGHGACDTILKQDCNSGAVASVQSLSDKKYVICLEKLMNASEDCCSYVDDLRATRATGDSKYHGSIPSSLFDQYEERCDDKKHCTGFTIVGVQGDFANLSDSSNVLNTGAIQVNPRTVSLNNLFPNSKKGINWTTKEAKNAILQIEQIGDGIFGEGPGASQGLDYHVVLTPQCASAIRDYNSRQSGGDNSYNAGGFNDYTLNVTNATTEPNKNMGEKGRTAVMSDEFRQILQNNCSDTNDGLGLLIQDKPDKIKDSSKVES